jgi:hypothetical protein
MKKILGTVVGLMVIMAMAIPASAFVFVYAEIEKDKDIYVEEVVYIYKDIYVEVDVVATPEGAAEANAIANQDNYFNWVSGDDGEPAYGNFRFVTITGSINDNTGIVGVNQDAGNMNNQGNNVAIAITDVEAFADAQSSASQWNSDNGVWIHELDPTVLQKSDLLVDSMNSNTGIIGANQSVGNMNNQLNSVALAAGLGGVLVAMAEADLGQFNGWNYVSEINTHKVDTIQNSLNGNHGIVSFNQSAGNMNNQANIVAISFTH